MILHGGFKFLLILRNSVRVPLAGVPLAQEFGTCPHCTNSAIMIFLKRKIDHGHGS